MGGREIRLGEPAWEYQDEAEYVSFATVRSTSRFEFGGIGSGLGTVDDGGTKEKSSDQRSNQRVSRPLIDLTSH